MELGGYANKIAHVDLTAGKVEFKPIPEEWALEVYRWTRPGREVCLR